MERLRIRGRPARRWNWKQCLEARLVIKILICKDKNKLGEENVTCKLGWGLGAV
jgi:hypothetical protein